MRAALTVLPEMEAVLYHNGIDVKRVMEASIHHKAKDGVTEITVTMIALEPEGEDKGMTPEPAIRKVIRDAVARALAANWTTEQVTNEVAYAITVLEGAQ